MTYLYKYTHITIRTKRKERIEYERTMAVGDGTVTDRPERWRN
jgi:hypothetical protein